MKKKRPSRRKSSKPPPQRGGARGATSRLPGAGRAAAVRGEHHLLYKVVELSTVDEGAIERTLNEWSAKGWNLDGIQFAMREASKRPAMAFVFFTREVLATAEAEPPAAPSPRAEPESRGHLARLAGDAPATVMSGGLPRVDPHTRLRQLAGLEDDPADGEP